MSTITETPGRVDRGEQRFLLRGVGWEGYEALLKMIGEGKTRVTYAQGDAELMSPLKAHESWKKRLGFVIETIAEELGISFEPAGSTTFRREDLDRGLEPDECYYFASAALIQPASRTIDLRVDPPPDLAIEIEHTSGVIPRLPIYAALGVPEVWRFDGEDLTVLHRQPDGTYAPSPVSATFPFLRLDAIVEWLDRADGIEALLWRRAFRAWVQAGFPPDDPIHRDDV